MSRPDRQRTLGLVQRAAGRLSCTKLIGSHLWTRLRRHHCEVRSPAQRLLVSTCIRLLALAYPAITKSSPKNASTLMHARNKRHRPKVRLPNFSSSIHRNRSILRPANRGFGRYPSYKTSRSANDRSIRRRRLRFKQRPRAYILHVGKNGGSGGKGAGVASQDAPGMPSIGPS